MDRWRLATAAALLLLAACTRAAPGATSSPSAASPTSTPALGAVIPAPGSTSTIYPPNPGALVVAIDPGHGGCLDWGVANPYTNDVAQSEKALTLGIATRLRDLLEADGLTVVMTRDTDVALAGDDYPPLGCSGPPFRDVNGDGLAGFGPDLPEATRTRDELSARIDLVNLARADVLVSIHINSLTDNGVAYPIAATQTYYSDERPWGVSESLVLANDIQSTVVAGMDAATDYDRQDRGLGSVNYYILAPPKAGEVRQPSRGSLMPAVLSEVGSMSLEEEARFLATPDGQQTIAASLFAGLTDWIQARAVGARIDAAIAGGSAGIAPTETAGTGPLFWPAILPTPVAGNVALPLRLTNTGTADWPEGLRVVVGWASSADPYLDQPPDGLTENGTPLPLLRPGESVEIAVDLAVPPGTGRQLAWISLRDGSSLYADFGIPALQLATR